MKARRRPAKLKQAASKRALWRLQADELRRQQQEDTARHDAKTLARDHHQAWP